jgi:thiol-disulfide isomerase/thioredoxin
MSSTASLKEIIFAAMLFCFTYPALSQDSSAHKVITGHTQVEHLENNTDHHWFSKNYSDYVYDTASVTALQHVSPDYNIVVIGGTWCPTTHTELPKFYKIIDDGKFPRNRVKLIFVDRDLKLPATTEKNYKVKKLPTFIVFKGEKEKGRIVELPNESIEKDLIKLFK